MEFRYITFDQTCMAFYKFPFCPTPSNALLYPQQALSAVCAADFPSHENWVYLGSRSLLSTGLFTPKMSCRPAPDPVVASAMGPLVSQCPVPQISNSARWEISDANRSSAQARESVCDEAKPKGTRNKWGGSSCPNRKQPAMFKKQNHTYLRPRPPKSERRLVSQQLPEPEHEPVDER